MIFGKHINRYYIKYSPVLLLGLCALVLVDYFQLAIPRLYRLTVNGVNNGAAEVGGQLLPFDMDFLLTHICKPLIFIIIALVTGRFLWRICFFGSAIRACTEIRGRMFDRLRTLSAQYYHKNNVGTLMSYFTNDLETVQECFGSGVLMFFDAAVLGVLSIVKMFRMNGVLTLLSLIPMGLLMLVGSVVGRYMTKKWQVRQEAFSDLSDFSQQSYSGIGVIKAFVKEGAELLAFRRLNKNNEKANVEYTKASTLLNIFVTLFVESVICVILGYGGYLTHRGVFNAGQLIEFIGYFTAIVWPVMAVSQLIEMRSRGKASLRRISALLDEVPGVADREDVQEPEAIYGDIEVRNLTFRYPGASVDALKSISFRIKAGESVGIVGKTGCGKTTIVSLLLRTYNTPDGTIFLDGADINTVPIKTVRKYIAYVPQDGFLFSDTIENNIAFASDTQQEQSVRHAAMMSDIHENIMSFTDGYKTVLGERGVTVSGGQKQRISIARALMKDAPILILDDSVSAVDTKTEEVILDNLSATRRGKTTILIAHRISTVERLDKIIFVSGGKIAGVGSHAELYDACPEYKKAVVLQRLDEEGAVSGNV